MAVSAAAGTTSKAMRRLLGVLQLEEEQAEGALGAAVAELRQLERASAAAGERERRGRRLVAASAASGSIADRLAGLEESTLARRTAAALAPRIAAAQARVAMRRQEFLSKRIERRQAETLLRAAQACQAREAAHRAQQEMDDWFLGKTVRARQRDPKDEPCRATEKLKRTGGENARREVASIPTVERRHRS